ncbi:MAG: carbohydrate ABC transporter permease [Oscillospiraceae bacterium]
MAKNKNAIKEGSKAFDIVVYVLAGILCLITVYPMYYVIILSISDPIHVAAGNIFLVPKGFSLNSYQMIFADVAMWRAYANTIFYVVATTLLMLITCVLAAYPLTSKSLIARKFITIFILIPMYFGGGLIPTYLLMTKIGLYNNSLAIILPAAVSVWNIILTRTYFNSIPETVRESASIDGASHFTILFRIYIPLAKPILAVVAIYTIVSTWNSWFNAMIYLPNPDLQPLQLYLRRVLIENTVDLTKLPMNEVEAAVQKQLSNMQLKYAMIVFTTLPVLITYPFFQKHFVKGIMVGSLKG